MNTNLDFQLIKEQIEGGKEPLWESALTLVCAVFAILVLSLAVVVFPY